MKSLDLLIYTCAVAPALLMLCSALISKLQHGTSAGKSVWSRFTALSVLAFISTLASLSLMLLSGSSEGERHQGNGIPGLAITALGCWIAVLVQLLGTVIGVFSSRYLQGEANQPRYVFGLASVLAMVQVLLLADHWFVLIGAWALTGMALKQLLCFYQDRPFALLAAHKKGIADRVADILLIAAAALAYFEVGSGSISVLLRHAEVHGASVFLEISAVCLVLAVVVRTALMPVHGWLTQVMEAPTPVSALLHAGVVNLGGFVLIRFASMLDEVQLARWLLVIFGLGTALLAGFVMLTRISIKVRLAWSTVAQMGFMVLECGLGLYQLAVLHLIGHSLYKAHNFLNASSIVRQTRTQMMQDPSNTTRLSLLTAPLISCATVALVHGVSTVEAWPWWWSVILGLAWAPVFWFPTPNKAQPSPWSRLSFGFCIVALLSFASLLWHAVPFGISNSPHHITGIVALVGMALMYLGLAILQMRLGSGATWRRWSYAGFYVDEQFTRSALKLWPTRWSGSALSASPAVLPDKESVRLQELQAASGG